MEPSVSAEREHLCGLSFVFLRFHWWLHSWLLWIFFPVLIYFNSKHMSAHLQMSSQWFMGKMGRAGEVMSGSWHSRAFLYVFVLSKSTPIISPSLLRLNLLKVCLQTISGNDRPGSARKHIGNSLPLAQVTNEQMHCKGRSC